MGTSLNCLTLSSWDKLINSFKEYDVCIKLEKKINLQEYFFAVPPHQLLLYDEAGRDVAGVVGPLEEGGNFTLLCELRGGKQ